MPVPVHRAVYRLSVLVSCYNSVAMIQTVEAVIDSSGRVLLLEDVSLPKGHRALVTVLDERADAGTLEPALLSEEALAEDWLRPEEDEAWSHLQLEP